MTLSENSNIFKNKKEIFKLGLRNLVSIVQRHSNRNCAQYVVYSFAYARSASLRSVTSLSQMLETVEQRGFLHCEV